MNLKAGMLVAAMLMACGGKGAKSPDKADDGPSAGEAAAAILGGAADGFNRGMSNSNRGECTSKSDCYSGEVCLIQRGQNRGQCTEAK